MKFYFSEQKERPRKSSKLEIQIACGDASGVS